MGKQRSSWGVSIASGLIVWNGSLMLAAFSAPISPANLFLTATSAAIIQVVALRLLFFRLHFDRTLGYGAVFGAVSGAMLITAEMALLPTLADRFSVWLPAATLTGAAVGALLSGLYQWDVKIAAEAPAAQPADHRRDVL